MMSNKKEIEKKVSELQKNLNDYKLQSILGNEKDTSKIKKLKREISTYMTRLTQEEIS